MNKKEDEMKDITSIDTADYSSQPLNEEERQIFKIISGKLVEPIEETDVYSNLYDIGINSITFIVIVVELESLCEIEFDDEMLALENVNNIKMLIDYVCEKKSVKA